MAPPTKQAKGLAWLFWVGFSCAVLAMISLFIGFATPYWIQSWTRVHSPLAHTGLWQICLSGYIKPRDPTLAAYVGCWWIHTTIFRDISDSIMPPWFRLVQAFTILSMLCLIVSAVLIGLFRPDGTRDSLYKKKPYKLMFVNALLLLVTAAMIFIDSLVFAMKTKDPEWMPRPHLNYLSWSFGFNVLAGFFAAFGGICITLIALILKAVEDNEVPMPWQPRVEASKPLHSTQQPHHTPSETSSKSYNSSQAPGVYAPPRPYSTPYQPSSAPIDRSQGYAPQKPHVTQYQPTSAPINRNAPGRDYTPQKQPYGTPYKPSQPPISQSTPSQQTPTKGYNPSYRQSTPYEQSAMPTSYNPSYRQAFNQPIKRTAVSTSSHDDTKESDV